MQNLKRLSHRIINFLTKSSKQNDSYADAILAIKFDAREAFNTVYFLVTLILLSPAFKMDEKGNMRPRLVRVRHRSSSIGTHIWKNNH